MANLDKDLLKALSDQPNKAVKLDQANITCYVLSADAFHYVEPFLIDRRRREEELRRDLQVAFDEFERGEVEAWDVEAVKREGRERLKRQSSAA